MISVQNELIHLQNDNMSLVLKARKDGKVELVHLGRPVFSADADSLSLNPGLGWGTSVLYTKDDWSSCLERIPFVLGETGRGDYREPSVELLKGGLPYTPDFVFQSAKALDAEPESQNGLPLARNPLGVLELVMMSRDGLVTLTQYFSLFSSAIATRMTLETQEDIEIRKLASLTADLPGEFYMHNFSGGWISESHRHSTRVGTAAVVNKSSYGFSSNARNAGVMMARKGATENGGDVYGINLIYSGNHYTSAQKSAQGLTRLVAGINPENFNYKLASGKRFETPQAVISYSDAGCNGMSAAMHKFVLDHVVPSAWAGKERPIVFNSWEGCMFKFDEAKLLGLAKKAAKLGCETFVLDDGWFGKRNDDKAGLGDYNVNKKKLPSGVTGLANKIRKMGLGFGLWFEPEAVNPDSDLYRAHPDWAIHQEGLTDLYGRNELLLDLRKPEVRDYIVENVGRIVDEAGVSYLKWDMNRESMLLGAEAFEYILGLYDVLRRIFEPRPELLLESCSSGGNRFDLGMLYFGPQAWASDDTDPVERLDIQQGLSYLYPQSCWGAHVSAAPHAQTLRNTPLPTRFNVAAFGMLGYELDLNYLVPTEEKEVKEQIEYYKNHRKLFQFGQLSRIPMEKGVSWQVTAEGGKEAVVGIFHKLVNAAPGYEFLKANMPEGNYLVKSKAQSLRVASFGGLLKHVTPVELNPDGVIIDIADKNYRMKDAVYETACSGSALKSGLPLPNMFLGTGYSDKMRMQGDFSSNLFYIKKI